MYFGKDFCGFILMWCGNLVTVGTSDDKDISTTETGTSYKKPSTNRVHFTTSEMICLAFGYLLLFSFILVIGFNLPRRNRRKKIIFIERRGQDVNVEFHLSNGHLVIRH
ncbi:unnamed protein product [Clavelina lepadiformis]|uniref:Uncharacterized protein n=1 Tax=Clavelina lepadiformis TaxID=159417 RepID=A0ABP0GBN6_CLALP